MKNRRADKIVVLERGQIIETGTHQELLEKGGTYKKLYELQFAEDEAPALLGDVVLCPQVAEKQAKDAGHSTEDELHLLCTHGILHLLGYDHAEPDEEKEMFGLQSKLITGWQEQRSRS